MIEADEGNVGTVQGGDEGQAAILAEQHLAREVRGDGVGNRVVDVEQVQVVIGCDFGHARGQGQVVRRVFKQGIVRDRDFVEGDVLLAAAQAEGLRVGDEVDLVTGGRQLDAEFGSDDAAAAVRGIAGNSDLHNEPEYRVQVEGTERGCASERKEARVQVRTDEERGEGRAVAIIAATRNPAEVRVRAKPSPVRSETRPMSHGETALRMRPML